MLLFDELRRLIGVLESLSEEECVPILSANVLRYDRAACDRIAAANRSAAAVGRPTTAEGAARSLAVFQFDVLKSLPSLLGRMEKVVREREGSPADRVAIASVLAYLVNPQDIVPDDLPGGAGLLDDAIVLVSVAKGMFHLLRPPNKTERDLVFEANVLASGIPPQLLGQLNQQIQVVWTVYHGFAGMPPMVAEQQLDLMLTQPLRFTPPPPAPHVPPMAPRTPFGGWPDNSSHIASFDDGGGFARTDAGYFIWD